MNKLLLLASVGLAIVLALCFALDDYKSNFYVFDQDELHQVALDAIAKHEGDSEALFTYVAKELNRLHPGHISEEQEWVFNNAGGAMGAMWVLHSSITEYVIIFGTTIGTEGHTGRFWADDYFTILEGEQWSYSEGAFEKEVFQPGDMHHLPRGHAKQYRMPDHCFALEYARGWIPLMLPFGVADTFSSTLDFVTLFRTFAIYARHSVGQLMLGKI